jgi:hypothetical protein
MHIGAQLFNCTLKSTALDERIIRAAGGLSERLSGFDFGGAGSFHGYRQEVDAGS